MKAETDDSIRADFLAEAGELMQRLGEQLVELERHPDDRELLNALFRGFHTVKGGAGFMQMEPLVALCHAVEEVLNVLRKGELQAHPEQMDAVLEALDCAQAMLAAAKAERQPEPAPAALFTRLREVMHQPAADSGTISDDEFEALLDQLHGPGCAPAGAPDPAPQVATSSMTEPMTDHGQAEPRPAAAASAAPAESSVRVDTAVLDDMMNLVGELVLVRNRLKTLLRSEAQQPQGRAVAELDQIARGLQAVVMRVRLQPIRKVFSRFPRIARETARGLGKQVEVALSGEDTGLDKNLVEALADPLVHMVRNSVDHGIELPPQRLAAGKPACGKLSLSAEQAGDHILITVADDGAGIDAERLRAKAAEKGLIAATEAARLSPQECLQLVFLPGLSTRDKISELSGRGVGMDVVKSAITALGGSVQIESRQGFGTQVRIRVPLTLAILPALMVGIGPRMLALPLAPVLDVFVLDPRRVRQLDRSEVLPYRQETLRLIDLHRWLGVSLRDDEQRQVVVVQAEGERCGLVVSRVHGREEVVIKPLGTMLRGLAGLAGATVTGSGRVALIVDIAGVAAATLAGG